MGQSEDRVLSFISKHFNKEIPDLPTHDEAAFEAVLKEAGLA